MTNPYVRERTGATPGSVTWLRALIAVGAGIAAVSVLALAASGDASAEEFGRLVWWVWPPFLCGYLAWRLPRLGRTGVRLTYLACAFWILGGLSALGSGDPRGLTQLILPVAILVLVTRPSARAWLATPQA